MKLIEFTAATLAEHPVYINPDHVVGVRRSSDKITLILINAAGADGQLAHISVRESPEEAIGKLTAE